MPAPNLSYGDSKLLLFWDLLPGNPRFEKIVASMRPRKSAGSNWHEASRDEIFYGITNSVLY